MTNYGFCYNISEIDQRTDQKYNWYNNCIRLATLVIFGRIVVLINITNVDLLIVLGDPLLGVKDKVPIYWLLIYSLVILGLFKELTLWMESKGQLTIMSIGVFEKIKIFGFRSSVLEMDPVNCYKFRWQINLIVVIFNRFILIHTPFIFIIINTFLITNPHFRYDLVYTFSGLLWSLILSFSLVNILTSAYLFAGYLFIVIIYYLGQFRSLVSRVEIDSIQVETSNMSINRKKMKFNLVIMEVIKFLNEIDYHINNIRYVVLFMFLLFTFSGDSFFFLGFFVRIHSKIVATMFTIVGLSIININGLSIIVSALAMEMREKLRRGLHRLCLRQTFRLTSSLKLLEIFDRTLGHFKGIKAGDAFIFDKKLFVIFIMENASTLMLFACNAQSLIGRSH
ncbi:uncharacterized protein LOC128395975 [Panonychus citri]|uniref:uncharacterized protein LOC128395975 n=1 Tax=Panonychus citri TaxID=50023 RepID=UPI0023076DF0|nr:uncharacterized protein LOC128395975 [Panonychus citri]